MAQATNTQLGEIQLAGDLAGNGGPQVGTNPQLKTMPGLVAGSYSLPVITVDSKGRITAIADGSGDLQNLIPAASPTTAGLVSIGDNLFIDTDDLPGYWVVNFGASLTSGSATGLANQACAMYGFTVSADHGEPQTVQVAGSLSQTVGSLITQLNSKLVGVVAGIVNGNFVVTSSTVGRTSSIQLTNVNLFACMTGFVNMGAPIDGIGSCELYAKRASNADYGVVKVGSGIDVDDGVISVSLADLPIATSTTLGGVIVPVAGHLTVDGAGNISVPVATSTVPGVVKVGSGLTVTGGALAIGSDPIPTATTSTKGAVQIGTNIDVAAGVISVATGTAAVKGVVQAGAGLVATAGVLSLAVATASTIGAVKVGSGLTVDGAGVISAVPIPDASTSVKGIVQVGSGLSVTAGVISVPNATASTVGLVRVGSGLSVASGVISAGLANGSTPGLISAGTSGRVTVTAGVIDINTAGLVTTTTTNTFTKAQVVTPVSFATTSIAPDLSLSNVFKWDCSSSSSTPTITGVTNAIAGGIYTFILKSSSFGGTNIVLPANFKKPSGVTVFSVAGNTTNVLSCVYDGTNFYCTLTKGFV